MDQDSTHSDNFPPDLSQTACVSFRQLQFQVEQHHPTRLPEFRTILKNAIANNENPATLSLQISSWTAPLSL
jgi:hypothetical protein